jgi:type VI protein secretion system component VasF
MPTRTRLVALANELRNARTRHLPMELAERIQHTIVRIEEMLASSTIDPASVDSVAAEARRLLAECDELSGRP